jgi:hypothetical protein
MSAENPGQRLDIGSHHLLDYFGCNFAASRRSMGQFLVAILSGQE